MNLQNSISLSYKLHHFRTIHGIPVSEFVIQAANDEIFNRNGHQTQYLFSFAALWSIRILVREKDIEIILPL